LKLKEQAIYFVVENVNSFFCVRAILDVVEGHAVCYMCCET